MSIPQAPKGGPVKPILPMQTKIKSKGGKIQPSMQQKMSSAMLGC